MVLTLSSNITIYIVFDIVCFTLRWRYSCFGTDGKGFQNNLDMYFEY